MDLSRTVYSRDLKITVMRALDAGARLGEVARKYQLSPKMLERWRSEWRAQTAESSEQRTIKWFDSGEQPNRFVQRWWRIPLVEQRRAEFDR